MKPEKIQAAREKLARLNARRVRQIAKFLSATAREASKPMYADRVIGTDFDHALEVISKAAWELSDIVVPRDLKTGYADARKLMQAVFSHAFRPGAPANEKETGRGKTSASVQHEGDSALRTDEPRKC